MAKTKIITNLEYPKPKIKKSSIYLCCFGSSSSSASTGSTNNTESGHQQRNLKHKSWFPWQRIGKTVPLLEGLEFDEKKKKIKQPKLKASYNKVQYSSSKVRSKSNLHNKTQQENHPTPTPTQKPPLIPHIVPNQPPSNSQRYQPSSENKSSENDTCQQSSPSPTIAAATAMSHWDSVPATKRHVHRTGPQTTPKQHVKHQNASRYYSPVVGTSVVMVTLVIMLLWGRLCAIVCTSTWLYFAHRFRVVHENDVVVIENTIDSSKELDFDSNLYKKKVVLKGLLERGHSGVL